MALKFEKDVVEQALEDHGKKLTHQQRYVIELRYGLYGNSVLTIEKIAEKLRLSVSRIYDLECEAEPFIKLGSKRYPKHKSPSAIKGLENPERAALLELYVERQEQGLDLYSGEEILRKWEGSQP